MNTAIRNFLTCALLASCCVLVRGVPAQDVASSPPAVPAAPAATEAPAAASHDADDADDADDETTVQRVEVTRRHGRHGRHDNDGNDVVSIGHDALLAEGGRADTVVSVFGSATSAGDVDDTVVSVFGDTRATGPVGDAAIAVLGNVYVNSKVGGDVIAVFGNVELGPEAEIRGEITVIGGVLIRDPNAVVHGGVSNIFSGDFGGFHWLRHWIERCLLYGRPLAFASGLGWAWGLALGCLALYVFLGLLFRDAVERCAQTFEAKPGHSFIAALLTILLTPVALILLCITVIGIPAVPLLMFALFCACAFGKVAVLASLGRRCMGAMAASAPTRTAIAVFVGGLVVLALYTIPVIGFIAYQLLNILGLGAVIYTLLLVARAARLASASATPAEAKGPVTPTPGFVAADEMAGAVRPESEPARPSEPVPPAEAPRINLVSAPRAGFWIRMAALLLDAILIGVLLGRFHDTVNVELIALATYGAVMWKLKSSTIGGIVCGLQVVRLDGREIDWPTAIVRALSCFLSLAVAGLGFIWIAVDPEKQSWHDKIAGTVVVRAPKSASLV